MLTPASEPWLSLARSDKVGCTAQIPLFSSIAMPPRWFCLVIVVSWLAMTSWLLWHDLLPHLLPGHPPGYSVELVEEARTTRPDSNWFVYKDGKKVANAKTHIQYLKSDVGSDSQERPADVIPPEPPEPPQRAFFAMIAEIKPQIIAAASNQDEPMGPFDANGVQIRKLESRYYIDLAGNLVGLWAGVNGETDPSSALGQIFGRVILTLEGEMESGRMSPRLSAELHPPEPVPLLGKRSIDFALPNIRNGEFMLMPLHPVNRHRGLYPGQSWQLRLIEPLTLAHQAVAGLHGLAGDFPVLHARVRTKEETIYHKGHPIACLVIDQEGDDVKLATWVARKTGLVMQQDAYLDSKRVHWVMKRD
jgi:hypothetical protein